jgi:outer membrane protein OmpA-like peptidoglycan-associated protein
MKLRFTAITLLTLGLAMAQAQERAPKFDADAAKTKLSGAVAKTPGKFITKGLGGDPIKSRFYTKDAVVITRQSGAKEEHPYVAVPLLFRVNSDDLLDGTSRENVSKVAQLLKDLGATGASFAIEGHASAEGDTQRNTDLSKLRAAKIQSLLREQGAPPGELARVEGFGSEHAQFKDPRTASESQLQQDRRVLVVKER